MNCDQVFDILTRGPFPTGCDSDAAVELHLQACYDCRQLAEALRPAVELFHESIDEDELADLPGYHGCVGLTEHSSTRVQTHAWAKKSLPRWAGGPSHRRATWQVVSAVLLAGVLAGLMISVGPPGTAMRPGSPTLSPRVTPNAALRLARLQLPTSCRSLDREAADQATDTGVYQCCTHCHTADREEATSQVSLAMAIDNCWSCHRQ